VMNMLVAGARGRIIRKRREQGEGEETSQRPEALVHSMILREPTDTNHEIARSARQNVTDGITPPHRNCHVSATSPGKTWSVREPKRCWLTDPNYHVSSLHHAPGDDKASELPPRPHKPVTTRRAEMK
jgi:hypothetical protein